MLSHDGGRLPASHGARKVGICYVCDDPAVRRSTLSVVVPFLALTLWCDAQSVNKEQRLLIQRAKNLVVSSLDSRLPKVTLEFFLKNEAEGSPTTWSVGNCEKLTGNSEPSVVTSTDCVAAEIVFQGLLTATVVLAMKPSSSSSPSPTLLSVTVTDQSGKNSVVRRLGDLPMELHRPQPKSPKDLPAKSPKDLSDSVTT